MSEVRMIKNTGRDLAAQHFAMMVDAAYDELYRAMKAGHARERALGWSASSLRSRLGICGAVNAISGERCQSLRKCVSDRVLRPGDPVYYDILHSYMGYRTCYYRCLRLAMRRTAMVDAYKRCRDYLDAAIERASGKDTSEIARLA